MRYPVENFTAEERALLAPHFTNLDRPGLRARQPAGDGQGRAVRPLLALPGHACAASSSRSSPPTSPTAARPFDGEEGERAAKLYERVFLGYGDDSIAQVGGAHIACEWVSNILTKLLQRGRLAAYLEQSTRYIPYDQPLPDDAGGGYRYYRDDELGPEFAAAMDELFAIYSRLAAAGRGLGGGALAARRRRARARPGGARSAPRRSTCCAACCPPRRSATSASSPPGRPTSSCCCGCWPRRCPEAREFGSMILARAAAGDAELRRPGRAARPRRRVDLLPARRAARRPSAGSPGSASTAARRAATLRRSSWSTSTAPRRTCSRPACSRPRRVPETEIRAAARRPRPRRAGRAARRPRRRARATAATGPAAASRRCATASRSSPTTAASATCSATGC